MRNFLMYLALSFLILFSTGSLEARNKVVVVKQRHTKVKIVKAKPLRPRSIEMRPTKIRTGYIWVDGYWKWNNRYRKYVWINGRTFKNKKNKVWIQGQWSKTRGGYFYTRGHWA